jgi:hypothetical protein
MTRILVSLNVGKNGEVKCFDQGNPVEDSCEVIDSGYISLISRARDMA